MAEGRARESESPEPGRPVSKSPVSVGSVSENGSSDAGASERSRAGKGRVHSRATAGRGSGETRAGNEGGGERLLPEHRLHKRPEYQRCYQTGRRYHGHLATLHFAPNQLEHPRIGITATRKVGSAVVRQRLKRRVREVYRRWSRRSQLPPRDLIVHLKPAAAEASFTDLRKELLRLFSRLLREGDRRAS